MKNNLVAGILRELADFTDMEDDQPYRSRAYRRAAQTIESLSEPIEKVSENGDLREIPGVGENIEKKIVEILHTGKLETLEKLKRASPVDVTSLMRVEGIGPKTVKALYKDLRIRNLDEFENAVKDGRIATFKGLRVASPQQLLERIDSARLASSRVLLVQAQEIANRVVERISKFQGTRRYSVAGSLRRMKETIGDLDILVETEKPAEAIEYFTEGEEVKEVLAAGDTKASIKLDRNFQVDLRVIPATSWGAALLYFTGSKAHNVELRTRALRMGYHLNEYGLFDEDNKTRVAGSSEEEIYAKLNLDYIEPELREARGEIVAAENHRLPRLVELKDIRGDLQMHTNWSDGAESARQMAEAARARGYEYIAITDHVGSLKIANAMDSKRIKEQSKEIESINKEYEENGIEFHVLHGAEVNIKSDGGLDMPDSVLREIDVVLASIHSGFAEEQEQITNRLLGAIRNEHVDIIAHPSGRLLLERAGYKFDLPRIVQEAVATKTVLEIDAYPNRLDLSDENAIEAIRSGCLLSIDTDAHVSSELEYMGIGVSQARRAWAEKKDILNALSYGELGAFLRS